MSVGKVYFARVANHRVVFNPALHAREDLVVMSAVFSQVVGQAGSINLNVIQPAGGIMAGPRWGILSVEVDGVLREIARGEIVGWPLTLDGEEIGIELSCKGPLTSNDVDLLFKAQDHTVPVQVEPSIEPRRTAPYLLSDPYVDPVTLEASLDPIAGSAPPVLTLYGAGADPDQSKILSITINITEPPASVVTLTESTSWTHHAHSLVDLGDGMAITTDIDNRSTYTPISLIESVDRLNLNGGFELISSKIEFNKTAPMRVYTEGRKVDPFTCLVTPAKYVDYPLHTISELKISAIAEAYQNRVETLEINVVPKILGIGGAAQLTETTSLQDPESLASVLTSISYTKWRTNYGFGSGTIPLISTLQSVERFGVGPTIWKDVDGVREASLPCMNAMVRRAARIAVERAHCVNLTIQTHDTAAIGLTLKDRVRIVDSRLPGGVAIGKVTGVEFAINAPSAITSISLSCPVSDPAHISNGVTVATDGLAEITIPETFESRMPTIHSEHMWAIMNGSGGPLVRYIEFTDDSREQELILGGTNDRNDYGTAPNSESGLENTGPIYGEGPDTDPDGEAEQLQPEYYNGSYQIKNPDRRIPKTGIKMELMDLSPVPQDSLPPVKLKLNNVIVKLPQGITI